jgi:Domain of unknown function (DUF5658)
MRRVTIYFLIAEALDFITTYMGIKMGGAELNPLLPYFGWTFLIAFKLIVILIVAFILQKKSTQWFDIAVPCIVTFFVAWNTINLIRF